MRSTSVPVFRCFGFEDFGMRDAGPQESWLKQGPSDNVKPLSAPFPEMTFVLGALSGMRDWKGSIQPRLLEVFG